jgi:succinate dehydrogenase / fumarate reductase cytochrome b subunit
VAVRGKNNTRPVHLNLFKIRLPVGGVLSILHRITGAALVLLLPLGVYALDRSLKDAEFFSDLSAGLTTSLGRATLLVIVWIFSQHFFSGLRHLLLDISIADEKSSARRGAWLAFMATALVVLWVGVCL